MAREHRELLDVIRSGDQDAAWLRFKRHLQLGTEELLASVPER